MNKFKLMLLSALIATQTAFTQGFSKKCIDEIMAISDSEEDFDLQDFIKDLASEVAKVKAQLKLPFGKPADSKMTDIGMTVGCINRSFGKNPKHSDKHQR